MIERECKRALPHSKQLRIVYVTVPRLPRDALAEVLCSQLSCGLMFVLQVQMICRPRSVEASPEFASESAAPGGLRACPHAT